MTEMLIADSPFKSIDDVVAEGKERTLNVSTSRLAHPASVGLLEHIRFRRNILH